MNVQFNRFQRLGVMGAGAVVVLAAALMMAAAPIRRAQAGSSAYPAALLHGLSWRNLGPNRAGRSIACAGSSARPLEYYSGATGGGLWKTTDGGLTWNPVTDGQITSSSVGAVAVAPSNPDVVYIGMGEKELRGNIMQGDGVYKSTDAGRTWQHMGLENTLSIARVRVDPTNPDIVFVAALGHPSAPNEDRGIYKSTDGGQHWTKVLYRDPRSGGVDLSIDPRNPQVIYASLWESWRVSWGMSSGGPGSGLFKSTDGGDHWTEITRNPGLPTGVIGKIGVSVSPADDSRVYAIVEAADGGVFRSDDAGATWTKVNDENTLRQRAFYYADITADPVDKDTVYGENVGAYKSTDGGRTWTSFHGGDSHDMWIDPKDNQRIIISNDSGSTVTTNGGRSWSPQSYPTAQLYHVALTGDDPYQVCGAQQDSSTVCVPSTGAGRGGGAGMWASFYAVGGGESGYIAPSPTDPNIFYAGSQGALLTRFDRRTGWSRDIEPYPRFFSGENSASLPERWQWTYPIVFDNFDPHILYTSSQHLWMTRNDGQSWQRISGDLTRHDPKTLGDSGGPITHDMNGPEVFATIFTIAPSHMEKGTIWTGSDDGMVWLTRDQGAHWTDVTPPEMPSLGRVSLIEASRHNAGEAYVAVNNYLQDDRKPYLFRTRDYGKSWTNIVNGIGAEDFLHAVREDVDRPGLLFAGTEHGIYISFNDGDDWQSLSLNLPDLQVSDIAIAPHDVVISTMGRSFYALDNIEPLRQLTPALASADSAHLFKPADAVRPSRPLQVDYLLPAPATHVAITILDGQGRVIQTYNAPPPGAAGRGRGGRGGGGGGGGRGGRGGGQATNNAGLNRFTWNMQYPGATSFPGLVFWGANVGEGPIAVPGTYSVRLTVDGVSQTAPFRIVEDPRQSATQADLQAEFDLAMRVRDAVSRANQAVIDVRALRDQVNARLALPGAAAIKTSGDALVQRLTGMEETIYQTKSHASEDPLNFPIKINNRIAHLMSVIQGGQDARPTDQTYAVFTTLSAELDTDLAGLKTIETVDVANFNRALSSANMQPITLTPVTGGPGGQ